MVTIITVLPAVISFSYTATAIIIANIFVSLELIATELV